MSNELHPELRESLRAILACDQVELVIWQMGLLEDADEILEWLDALEHNVDPDALLVAP